MGLSDRLSEAWRAGHDAVAEHEVRRARTLPPRSGFAALALGLDPARLARVVGTLPVGRRWRSVLLITDSTDVSVYRLSGVVTEHLPSTRSPDDDPAARRDHVLRRLDLLYAKWQLGRCAAHGPEAVRLIRCWQVTAGGAAGAQSIRTDEFL